MNYQIKTNQEPISSEIFLPTSKSITNRLLIIRALSDKKFTIKNPSTSDDTKVLEEALKNSEKQLINIGHAGTSMRFLTALFSTQKNTQKVLTGSERMKNRPIKILVDALQQIGATIKYIEKDGYPPLKIIGSQLTGNRINIDGGVSSQYISALLMIAPTLPQGLVLTLTNKIISRPYIYLTLNLMKHFGIDYRFDDNVIKINHQKYNSNAIEYFNVEADWSGASYWYEIAALANEANLKIYGLEKNSLQGDAKVSELFEQLGVKSIFKENCIELQKNNQRTTKFEYNFISQPDLAQTFAVTLCMLQIPFKLSGLESLKIKETDRIAALINELAKFGYEIIETAAGVIECDARQKQTVNASDISIETYNDHRMALAFAPVALKNPGFFIHKPEVVSKSYPNYWSDLKKAGFFINEV